jgi:hypothetical protein
MRKTPRQIGIEDCLQIAIEDEPAVLHMAARGRLHPGIGDQDPKRRHRCAEGDHHGRSQVHGPRHALPAEYHDAEEARLEHERHGAFETEHIAKESPRDLGESRPVGAKFELQRQSGDHADGKIQQEEAAPKARMVIPGDIFGAQP